MNNRHKKFPISNLVTAILCLACIVAYIVFYSTAANYISQKLFLAVAVVWGLVLPVFIVVALANIKYCLNESKFRKVEQFGTDGVCQIVDCQMRIYNNKQWNRRYSLVVKYHENGIEKTYTTEYDYIEEEYQYFTTLQEIKYRYKDDVLIITEEVPVTGHMKSKFLRIFLAVWQILGWIGLALMLAGIAATLIAERNLYLIVGVLCMFVPNLLCALIYAVHFFITGE